MTFSQIKNFIAVIEAGSFSKAEERTFLTKQALKKQIDSLEAELDIKLIQRTNQGLLPTKAGELFYNSSVKSLAQWKELIKECQRISNNQNRLRIANPFHPRLLLSDVINKFAAENPEIFLDIIISQNHQQLTRKILNDELDIAEFIYRPSDVPCGITYTEVATMHYSCLVTDTHPLAGKKLIEPEDLIPYTVGIKGNSNMELMTQLKQADPRIRIENLNDNSMPTIYNVCYNHGVYISKAFFSRELPPLVSIPLATNIQFSCGVIYRSEPSLAVQKFLQLVEEYKHTLV